jgi:putative restriction endonuclease
LRRATWATCRATVCFGRVRVFGQYGAAIVDAAHIEPFAETQKDDIENGLALCKNAHWMFDEGLWSVQR